MAKKKREFPVHKGWVTLPQAAQELKISRQRAHTLLQEGRFKSAEVLEGPSTVYVIKRKELDRMLVERANGASGADS